MCSFLSLKTPAVNRFLFTTVFLSSVIMKAIVGAHILSDVNYI